MEFRIEDLLRHCADLRDDHYEGARSREDREVVFRRAVELLDPEVREVYEAAGAALLGGAGTVTATGVTSDGGRLEARWEMRWPEQERAGVDAVAVVAHLSSVHGHLEGSTTGMWPLAVASPEDARRQLPILHAIVEAELHHRVLAADWSVLPAARPS